jgi:CRISPR/Cas system CMR-associated protein Cmr1 (group 7 of RAMP superfamily)
MDDPLAIIYEKNMLRGIGAALALGTASLAPAKDTVNDYKTMAIQVADHIQFLNNQIKDSKNKEVFIQLKEKEINRLKEIILQLREMGVSDSEIRKLNK